MKRHPLANAQQARLDILYGGTEEEILRECFQLARDSVRTLELDESVMILNSLVGNSRFEPRFFALAEKHPDQVRGATYYGKKLMDRFEFLRFIIPHLKIRMVILNSFELAVFNSRHRMQLLELIKWMRDDMNIHLIICMQNPPANYGSQGSLKLMASSVDRVGGHMASLKEVSMGAIPAEMDHSGWPYRHTPSALVDEETAAESVVRERIEQQRRINAEASEAVTDEARERERKIESDREREIEDEIERELRHDRVLTEPRTNGFTDAEESFATHALEEHHWTDDHSPFSKGSDV